MSRAAVIGATAALVAGCSADAISAGDSGDSGDSGDDAIADATLDSYGEWGDAPHPEYGGPPCDIGTWEDCLRDASDAATDVSDAATDVSDAATDVSDAATDDGALDGADD